jgi:hypothetical protein
VGFAINDPVNTNLQNLIQLYTVRPLWNTERKPAISLAGLLQVGRQLSPLSRFFQVLVIEMQFPCESLVDARNVFHMNRRILVHGVVEEHRQHDHAEVLSEV